MNDMKSATMLAMQATRTHDGQAVYPAGTPVPPWAHGWVQCSLSSAAYATWVASEDMARYQEDWTAVKAAAGKLRTRKQCLAALSELAITLPPRSTCKDMRLAYEVTFMADLWPLRAVK